MHPDIPFLNSPAKKTDSPFTGFQDLMHYRIRDVLLVSSLYDLFVFEEDGRLYELIRREYRGLNLSHSPEITRVSRGDEAIRLAQEMQSFDLIITTQHIEDMHAANLAKEIRSAGLTIPVVLLVYDNKELQELQKYWDMSLFNQVFIWTGDFRILIAIIKHLEDIENVEHDSKIIGVQSIILVEDNVLFYSSYLPLLYQIILQQSQQLIEEGVNLRDKFLRLRARPKILLCTNYEQAWTYFTRYEETVLGIISDIDFWRKGKLEKGAGLAFARNVRKLRSDIPILLQSNQPDYEEEAYKTNASFLLKNSPTLLQDVKEFAVEKFGFGDFVFHTPDGRETGRASDLKGLQNLLKTVPEESIRYHSERNHFSNWLKARTEFSLAHKLRPRRVGDYDSIEELRNDLVQSVTEYRKRRQTGTLIDFKASSFDLESGLARIGGGSIGGKARGLTFINFLLNKYQLSDYFKGVKIQIPPGVILGTEVFDYFLDENYLRSFALNEQNDSLITERFLEAPFFQPETVLDLREFLKLVREPLAIRSSSLLEDSQYHPFAGVYETFMFPNNHPDLEVRLQELLLTIKHVYASTYYKASKDYINVTSYRLEEEKMAIIIQKMVGARYGDRFYPTFSGVAKSYNFYPAPPQTSDDGIVSVALGLGAMVVDGGITVKFSPKFPTHLLQFSSPKESLRNSQHQFYALNLGSKDTSSCTTADPCVKLYAVADAEEDGSLYHVGSTYSHENEMIYDGLSREGTRLVTFAPILKQNIFPLPKIVELLLKMGVWGVGTPVEIEFAVNMNTKKGQDKEFGLLQMRPLVLQQEMEILHIEEEKEEHLLCSSTSVLGHGIINDIYDVVYVDHQKFDRSKTVEIAAEIGILNAALTKEEKPYLLIGLGRWGSADPWLGIPVKWDQISGAKTIVETNFKDMMVTPSQGSHFFQNLTSFMIGYFTINPVKKEGFIDWDWLKAQKHVEEKIYTRHIHLEQPLTVKMNGHNNSGIVLKPKKGNAK